MTPRAGVTVGAPGNVRGAVFMMLATGAFTVNDALMKSLAHELPLFQAIFMRGVVATGLLAAAAWWSGALAPGRLGRDRGRLALRVVAEIGATTLFVNALFHMPIANATAILLVAPRGAARAAALFLGEPVGWRRWAAVLVGFAGVMLIVRPGGDGFNAYALSALAAVVCLVVREIVTRRFAEGVPSLLVALATAAGITMFCAPVALAGAWVPPTAAALGLLAGAASFLIVGYLFGVMAMRVGEIGFVSPFRYTVMIWALVLGIAVFGDVPDRLTLLGSGIVIATGLYAWHRERRRRPPTVVTG